MQAMLTRPRRVRTNARASADHRAAPSRSRKDGRISAIVGVERRMDRGDHAHAAETVAPGISAQAVRAVTA